MGAVAACAPATADAEVTAVRFGQLSVQLQGGEKIGARAQGVFCFPAGKVRWNDLALPNSEQLEQALAAKFQSVPHIRIIRTTRLVSAASSTDMTISAKILKASLSLCIPGPDFGIGTRPVKGRGSLIIEWEIGSEGSPGMTRHEVIEHVFDFRNEDPRKSPEVLAHAIADSAQSIFR